ncbi:alpha/beta fold hydrolase [Candidatus Woesebacteria bacterium]|nr:alpha/beta fold hydrolase [Candidatus Woesebacteria bacterium]
MGEMQIDSAGSMLSIEALKKTEFDPGEIKSVEIITGESRYQKSIVSYLSDGYKINALLGVPKGVTPDGGWPVIIFNHGYIDPKIYRTNEKYVAYFDRLVLAGYIVVKSDYRGHGSSEGSAEGGYGSDGYVRDVRQLVASMKKYPGVDPERIGMWGHSMGGHITLRTMVSSNDVKAGVIWAGVVASYPDLLNNWRRTSSSPLPSPSYPGRRWRNLLQEKYGTPEQNPEFWNSISATSCLGDISGPLELHHGTADTSVPIAFSRTLKEKMTTVNKQVELYEYPGDDHNISQNFGVAMNRTIEFFDEHLAKK